MRRRGTIKIKARERKEASDSETHTLVSPAL